MEHFLETTIFIGGFLTVAALVHTWSTYSHVPYTVALLVIGFLAQLIGSLTGYQPDVSLSPDLIYYLLLPMLLFEAAMHLQMHQFRLQFKTITLLATFGVLVSVAVVSTLLPLMLGIPFEAALLFGVLISATDPIAVLALFKTLGAPKRLAMLADGESMFNDATAVILFRLVAAIVVGGSVFNETTVVDGLLGFGYVFVGSIIAGAVVGYLISAVIEVIDNDAMVETTLTVGAALLSFGAMEHFLGLSGVISAVSAGIVVGNFGPSRFSAHVVEFVEKFWEYLSFIVISLVFFFSAYGIDTAPFVTQPPVWLVAVLVVLIARAASVYVSFAISNRLPMFKDEPNVPASWQHVLVWAGLRGVIPLVLVFSLPETYAYRDILLQFTLGTFIFTVFVNGLTIEGLLKRLRLHIPPNEELIVKEEMSILELEQRKEQLTHIAKGEFAKSHIGDMLFKIEKEEQVHKKRLVRLANAPEFKTSLKLQLLHYQREIVQRLFREGYIHENALFDLIAQFDMQEDALEYPEVSRGRAMEEGGKIDSYSWYKRRLNRVRELVKSMPFLGSILTQTEEDLVVNRYSMVRARLVTSHEVLAYLRTILDIVDSQAGKRVVLSLIRDFEDYRDSDLVEVKEKAKKYPQWVDGYQRRLLEQLVWPRNLEHEG
jgi:monovalent cation:H+ antiporter, CPA1 family